MEYDTKQITLKMIQKFIIFKNKTVLEIGCGEGKISSLLADDAKKYIGIDPDIESIQHAAGLYKNVDFRLGSGESLEFNDLNFDIVLFTLSLHHQNSFLALAEADRVLKEKGELLIIEPAVDGEFQQFFHLFDDETDQIKYALKNIRASDFSLERHETFNAQVWFANKKELCSYHFSRETITPGDTDRILEQLNRYQPSLDENQPIYLTDKIDIYYLIK